MLGEYEECNKCDGSGNERFDDVLMDCNECEGQGHIFIPVNKEEIVFLNIYSVTRHYGGAEEGGWWYNWDECIESIPVKNKYSDLMKETVIKQNESKKYGNIYSVLGGRDIEVRIEATPKESETKERPYYE